MATLESESGKRVLDRPGLYWLDGPVVRPGPSDPAAAGARVLVALLGDFLVAPNPSGRPCDGGDPSGPPAYCVTLGGRLPLGGIELLADRTTIVVARDAHCQSVRYRYTRLGPAISKALPAAATVRCAYTGQPLGGAVAVRCSDCLSLYHREDAWESELSFRCPACGWSDRGEDR